VRSNAGRSGLTSRPPQSLPSSTSASRGVSSIGLRPYYSSSLISAHGSFFVMGPVNTAIVRRSWSLFRSQHQLAPRESSGKIVTYGDKFTYSESQVFDKRGGLGSRVAAWVVGLILTVSLATMMKSRIVRENDNCLIAKPDSC
jgi:hypothetical protein